MPVEAFPPDILAMHVCAFRLHLKVNITFMLLHLNKNKNKKNCI